MDFPGGASGKEPTCQRRRQERLRFDPWVGKIPWRKAWQPTPVLSPGESHGQRSLVAESRTRLKWLAHTWLTAWICNGQIRIWGAPAEAGQGHLLPTPSAQCGSEGSRSVPCFSHFCASPASWFCGFTGVPNAELKPCLVFLSYDALWCTSRGRCVWDEFCSDVSHRLWIQRQPASTIH